MATDARLAMLERPASVAVHDDGKLSVIVWGAAPAVPRAGDLAWARCAVERLVSKRCWAYLLYGSGLLINYAPIMVWVRSGPTLTRPIGNSVSASMRSKYAWAPAGKAERSVV